MARRSSSWMLLAILGTAFLALGANAACMDADCSPVAVGEGMMGITSMPSQPVQDRPLTGTPKPACDNPVQCLVDPCASATCLAGTQCVSNYCGGCNFECLPIDNRVYKGGKANGGLEARTPVGNIKAGAGASAGVKGPAAGTCKDGSKPVQCFANPCDVSNKCPAGTTCKADYCGGCNTRCFNKAGVEIKARVEAVVKPITKPATSPCAAVLCAPTKVCVALGKQAKCVEKLQLGATLSAAYAAGFKAGQAQCA